jgi:hypothetical protein
VGRSGKPDTDPYLTNRIGMGLCGSDVGFVGSGYEAAEGVPEIEARSPSRKPSQMSVTSVITVMIETKSLI